MLKDQTVISIGTFCRVYLADSKMTQVALVTFIDEENNTADVLLERSQRELCSVPINNIQALKNIEQTLYDHQSNQYSQRSSIKFIASKLTEMGQTPEDIKELGNSVFKVFDYESAIDFYLASLSVLKSICMNLSIGSSVLVKRSDMEYMVAMVVDIDDNTIEIDYDNEENIVSKSVIVNHNDVILLFSSRKRHEGSIVDVENTGTRILQRSLYINLARCNMKLDRPGWATYYASLSMAVTKSLKYDGHDDNTILKFFRDELVVRANALLIAGRPKLASADCDKLMKLGDTESLSRAKQIQQSIKSFQQNRRKSNRKLIKQLMNWVDASIEQSSIRQQDLFLEDHNVIER